MIEAGIEYTFLWIIGWGLLKITDAEIVLEDNVSGVASLNAIENGHQSRFASSVASYEAHLLSLGDGERKVVEKYIGTERLGQILNVENRLHVSVCY